MYGGAPGNGHSFSGSARSDVPLDDSDTEAQYHQMEDDEGYRQPMRTGYTDRLIDPPYMEDPMQLPMLLGGLEEDLMDQARIRSILHRRSRMLRWKTTLLWAGLTTISVRMTC